jgi:hypothetical protein
MTYDYQRVGRYGNLAEHWAADNYPIRLDYPTVEGLKFDATDENDGRPWDVKASMTNGVRPTFKFWKDQHETLANHDGGYILIWYRANPDSIDVLDSRSILSRDIRITNWTNPGPTHHRSDTKEAQIPADELRS